MSGAANGADAILQFVRDHAVESPQPAFALGHSLRRKTQEVRHRGLHYQLDGLSDLFPAFERLSSTGGLGSILGYRPQRREDDSAKYLVLLEYLVCVESLRVAERSELPGFRRYGAPVKVRARPFQIIRDTIEQQGYVIEQVLGRKNLIVTKCDTRADPFQPALNDVLAMRADARRKNGPE